MASFCARSPSSVGIVFLATAFLRILSALPLATGPAGAASQFSSNRVFIAPIAIGSSSTATREALTTLPFRFRLRFGEYERSFLPDLLHSQNDCAFFEKSTAR